MKRVSAIALLCLLAGVAHGQSLEVNQAEIIVSFRQACMSLLMASGIVGCRGEVLWRMANGCEEETRAAGGA